MCGVRWRHPGVRAGSGGGVFCSICRRLGVDSRFISSGQKPLRPLGWHSQLPHSGGARDGATAMAGNAGASAPAIDRAVLSGSHVRARLVLWAGGQVS